MSSETKLRLNNNKFFQNVGDQLNLSGDTEIFNGITFIDGNQANGRILMSDGQGNFSWSAVTTSVNVDNGLNNSGGTISLGGDLLIDTTIDLDNNQLIFSGTNAYVYSDNGLLKYGGDYSSLFTNRSIIDKGYLTMLDNNTISGFTNLGGGEGIFYEINVDNDILFKTLIAGDNINFDYSNNEITINSTGGGQTQDPIPIVIAFG